MFSGKTLYILASCEGAVPVTTRRIHFVVLSLLVSPLNDEIVYLKYLEFYKSTLDSLQ